MKRAFDIALSVPALLLLAPLLFLIAIAVACTSPGGAIFRQERVGMGGRTFEILKFRTMLPAGDTTGQLTVGNDPRITRVGALLRNTKLDELPQLLNVVRGDMSLVGPRPELPKYVAYWPPAERDIILSVRPGITDPASIELRYEAELLAIQADPVQYYVDVLIPRKVATYVAYVHAQSIVGDVRIVIVTLTALLRSSKSRALRPPPHDRTRVREASSQLTFRPLASTDAAAAAVLHTAAFPTFFLSELGVRFLKQFYIALAEDPRCIAIVALQGDEVVGVAAGATNHEGFLTSLVRQRLLAFSLALAPRIARHPRLIPRLLHRLSGPDIDVRDHPAVLSSICVSNAYQGKGVGGALLREWCAHLREHGADRVHLTTDARDNKRTLEFYEAAGWRISSTFTTRDGRRMHVMIIELGAS